jgi:hypothetical protein
MTSRIPGIRRLTAVALLTGTALVAACGSPDKVTRTTTTSEQTSATAPAPIVSSTTTTTTRQTQP